MLKAKNTLLRGDEILSFLGFEKIPYSIGERERILEIFRQVAMTLRNMYLNTSCEEIKDDLVKGIEANPEFTESTLERIKKRAGEIFYYYMFRYFIYFFFQESQSKTIHLDIDSHPKNVEKDKEKKKDSEDKSITTAEDLKNLHETISKYLENVYLFSFFLFLQFLKNMYNYYYYFMIIYYVCYYRKKNNKR